MNEITIKGIYRDRLMDCGGRLILDTGWKSNLIVRRCRMLLAGFMKNETAFGIQSIQFGSGQASWDTVPPPAADPNTTVGLVDAAPFSLPVASLTLQYLSDADAIVVVPTNRIQIVATLGPGQPPPAGSPPFPLREFGLFGKLNGADFMLDDIRHPLIKMDGPTTLERRIRLIF